MSVTIRRAILADAHAIAEVHVASWRSTYRGLVPQAHLDGLSVERRETMWTSVLGDARTQTLVFVATADDGRIVGFAAGGPPQVPDSTYPAYTGELYAIYLLADHQGRGTGRQLVASLAHALATRGMTSLLVWVLEGNPACHFYAALGGVRAGEKPIDIGGATLTELAYGWPDSAPLRGITGTASQTPMSLAFTPSLSDLYDLRPIPPSAHFSSPSLCPLSTHPRPLCVLCGSFLSVWPSVSSVSSL